MNEYIWLTADKIVEFVEKNGFSCNCINYVWRNNCHSRSLSCSEKNNKMDDFSIELVCGRKSEGSNNYYTVLQEESKTSDMEDIRQLCAITAF